MGQKIFRDWITVDGSSGFKAEADRYHLYVSLACPWAHRTLIMRKLKKLESLISLSIVDPILGEDGWKFSEYPGSISDTANGYQHLYQVYSKADTNYNGRITVPVLWDKKTNTIVNNESSEIIRMFNSAFDKLTGSKDDFYPKVLQTEINQINDSIYNHVNLGVYKCGFATEQSVYNKAFDLLFSELDRLESHLSQHRYLVGAQITEADWRLFTTLVRFDMVYYVHFKCNWRLIIDYPHLYAYLRELYQYPDIAETVNFDHIKIHYYCSQKRINPVGLIPKGPNLNLEAPHHREQIGK
jgi:putative glutathione S-transferase